GRETTAAITTPFPKPEKQTGGLLQVLKAAAPQQTAAPASTVANPKASAVVAMRETSSFALTPAVYIPVPQPRPDYPQAPARIIPAGMKATANSATHRFTDGTYAGPVTDAYYGPIQIQASIQGGRLTALKVLKYPSDRRTSVRINRQALPMLRDEAISAQSANVDIISGATLTSRAFIQSLDGALRKASS
ncbi:MAG: FMN-binding protein, partial [Mesorhizobium sp.]